MWQSAPPLSGFLQAEPFQGRPVSERTEVRILYDDEAIYVGVTLFDTDPSLIVTTDTRRDPDLNVMDSFHQCTADAPSPTIGNGFSAASISGDILLKSHASV